MLLLGLAGSFTLARFGNGWRVNLVISIQIYFHLIALLLPFNMYSFCANEAHLVTWGLLCKEVWLREFMYICTYSMFQK
jgi:hypothetical protein